MANVGSNIPRKKTDNFLASCFNLKFTFDLITHHVSCCCYCCFCCCCRRYWFPVDAIGGCCCCTFQSKSFWKYSPECSLYATLCFWNTLNLSLKHVWMNKHFLITIAGLNLMILKKYKNLLLWDNSADIRQQFTSSQCYISFP